MAEIRASETAPRTDSGEWPLPWQEVAGERNGPLAWVEYAAVRAAVETLSRLPVGAQRSLTGGLARLARRFDAGHTRTAREFLEQALGPDLPRERREALVLESYRHFFRLMLDEAHFDERVVRGDLLAHFEIVMCPEAKAVLEEGGSTISVTGHLGAWEAISALMPRLGFRPFYGVARPPENRPLSQFVQRSRERRGLRMLHRHGAVQSIVQALGAGAHVGLLIDQRAHRKTVLAPFFGRLAHCERTIPVLLKRMKVPVLVAGCTTTGEPFRYRAEFPRVFRPEEFAGRSPEEVLASLHAELERMILARPEQYFWLHDRYRNAPAAPQGAPARPAAGPPALPPCPPCDRERAEGGGDEDRE